MSAIVCIDCTCESDDQADAAAALIATGLTVWAACRVVWGGAS